MKDASVVVAGTSTRFMYLFASFVPTPISHPAFFDLTPVSHSYFGLKKLHESSQNRQDGTLSGQYQLGAERSRRAYFIFVFSPSNMYLTFKVPALETRWPRL